MSFTAIQNYFFAPTVFSKYSVKKQDITLLVAMQLADSGHFGLSRKKLAMFCQANHQITDYRNLKRVLDPLIVSGYISVWNKKLYLSDKGILLVNKIERQIKKVAVAD